MLLYQCMSTTVNGLLPCIFSENKKNLLSRKYGGSCINKRDAPELVKEMLLLHFAQIAERLPKCSVSENIFSRVDLVKYYRQEHESAGRQF